MTIATEGMEQNPYQDAEQTQYLTFRIGSEEYAIGVLHVKEILEYDTLTKVPNTPGSIRGVINLRGSVVPVVDLAVKFGSKESTITKRTCIVIVEVDLNGERAVMGVMADSVSQVIDLLPGDIEPAPSFGTRVNVAYLHGMARSTTGKKFVLLLDTGKVLSTDELLAASELGQEDVAITAPRRKRRSKHSPEAFEAAGPVQAETGNPTAEPQQTEA